MEKLSLFIAIFVLLYVGGKLLPRDDTDPPSGDRSGLILYTDHGTGMQYISRGLFGGLTPRLDADGKHMQVAPKQEAE